MTYERMSQISLAIVVTLGFFSVILTFMFGINVSELMREPLLILIGSLSSSFGAIIQYFFGSSSGSAAKNELLLKTGSNDNT